MESKDKRALKSSNLQKPGRRTRSENKEGRDLEEERKSRQSRVCTRRKC